MSSPMTTRSTRPGGAKVLVDYGDIPVAVDCCYDFEESWGSQPAGMSLVRRNGLQPLGCHPIEHFLYQFDERSLSVSGSLDQRQDGRDAVGLGWIDQLAQRTQLDTALTVPNRMRAFGPGRFGSSKAASTAVGGSGRAKHSPSTGGKRLLGRDGFSQLVRAFRNISDAIVVQEQDSVGNIDEGARAACHQDC